MSKLAQALKLETNGQRVGQITPLRFVDITSETHGRDYGHHIEYFLHADFRARIVLMEDSLRTAQSHSCVKRACENIIQGVFGEFLAPMLHIQQSLIEGDIQRALKELDALRAQMFDV